MSFNGYGRAPAQQGLAGPADEPGGAARPFRAYSWLGAAGVALSLLVMIAVSLARASWMLPTLPMPRTGPPYELAGWHLQQGDVTVALWIAALAGGAGLAAALVAVRRGARPPLGAILVAAAVVVAVLTILPPAGSTDSLDYMAFGRIVVLGHTPYVMVPWDLMRLHDVVAKSIPVEWDKNPTPYGPAATVEEYLAARLGGLSAARIVFWLKLWNAVAFGLVALIADRLLRSRPAERLRAHLLWTVNPLLIWQLIAAAHLDVLAAAAGLLGLVVATGISPESGIRPRAGRLLLAGALIGLAADVKITFLLYGLGLAWALRRYPAGWATAALGMLAVLLPSYAWFGPPALHSVIARDDKTTADNFYQLFSRAHQGFLMQHVDLIATILVVSLVILALRYLPGRAAASPAIFAALTLSVAFLFVWQYQLPSYDAMIVCLLILVPATALDWLVLLRLTAGTIALMPGNPEPIRQHVLSRITYYELNWVVPGVLVGAVAGLIGLCLVGVRQSRRAPAPARSAAGFAQPPLAVAGPAAAGAPGPVVTSGPADPDALDLKADPAPAAGLAGTEDRAPGADVPPIDLDQAIDLGRQQRAVSSD
jgi:hypothetical protein